jgi:cell division protein FtsB
VLYFSFFLLVLGFLIINESGFIERYRRESQLKTFQTQIDSLKKFSDSLQNEVDSLKTSNKTIEKVAREKYNFRKPNEVIFEIEEK